MVFFCNAAADYADNLFFIVYSKISALTLLMEYEKAIQPAKAPERQQLLVFI